MSAKTKSATIQVRVMPLVKATSEQIFRRMGLSMSHAIELFLRRVMIDERIPFEVVALQHFQIGGFSGDRPNGHPLTGKESDLAWERDELATGIRKKGERSKKKFKKIFLGPRTSSQIRTKTRSEKGETGHN